MPELPEVETTCQGISPHIVNQTIKHLVVRCANLRWPIPKNLSNQLSHQQITAVSRRAKYILIHTTNGIIICHLGMSGCLKVTQPDVSLEKHDHFDLVLEHCVLRYNDPRRFGCLLFTQDPLEQHPLFEHLGPEPLAAQFNAAYLQKKAQRSKSSIKTFIMNQKIVVGVGNIYASEALFLAKIHPKRAAHRISRIRLEQLVDAIKSVLAKAITAGGTTLKDFYRSDGQPGYFKQELCVYDRDNQPCRRCNTKIKKIILGQRSSFYCTVCQT